MTLRSEVLSRSRPSNEGFMSKLFGGQSAYMEIPEETEKAIFFLLKNSDKLNQTFGNPAWNKEHLAIAENNKLWSHLTLDGKVPTNFKAALEHTYSEAKHFAQEGAKSLNQFGESLYETRNKIDKAFADGKITDPNKAIIDTYGKVKDPALGLRYAKPLFGGVTVQVAQNGKVEKTNTFKTSAAGVSLPPEEIAQSVTVALKIIKDSSIFVEDWNDLKFFGTPGIDTSEGIWRSDDVNLEDDEISKISAAVDAEGNGLKAEVVYLTPLQSVQQAAIDFIRLLNASVKK